MEHKHSTITLLKITEKKQALKATTDDGCTEARPILDKFEDKYKLDIQVITIGSHCYSYPSMCKSLQKSCTT